MYAEDKTNRQREHENERDNKFYILLWEMIPQSRAYIIKKRSFAR